MTQPPLEGSTSGRAETTQVTLHLAGTAHEFQMPRAVLDEINPQRETTLLDAGEAAGLELPYSCCSGVCATCFARLMQGEVTHIENHILTEEELAAGQILICQAVPLSASVEITFTEFDDAK